MADDRNPYVMLGIPFGAVRDVATRAFAKRARGARRQRGVAPGGVPLTELTWALNQVEENIRDPRTALHVFRVPADPWALEPRAEGVLRPGPERLARQSGPSDESWSRLLDAARVEALHQIHQHTAAVAALPAR